MYKYIIEDIDLKITNEELLKKIRITNNSEDEDYQKVTNMLKDALVCARPKYSYGIAAIEQKGENYVVIEGHRIESPLVRRNLDKIHRIFPYIATCGTEVDLWSCQYTDMLEHFWADEIKSMILFKCIEVMQKSVKEKYFSSGYMSQMSPGSLPEWPITEQLLIFDLIGENTEKIGVTLTDSFLMIPSKSISGFFFTSECHFENCRLCPMHNCPNRKVKYQKTTKI